MSKLLLLFITIGLTGCATANVATIGVEKSTTTLDQTANIMQNDRGDIALRVKERIGLVRGEQKYFSKIIVVPKESFHGEIEKQIAIREWRINDLERSHLALKTKNINYRKKHLLTLKEKGIIYLKASGRIYPPAYVRENVQQRKLDEFKPIETLQENDERYFRYPYNGKTYEIHPDHNVHIPGQKPEQTRWWGYPIKIPLFVPAVAIDVATLAIQIPVFCSHYGDAWN